MHMIEKQTCVFGGTITGQKSSFFIKCENIHTTSFASAEGEANTHMSILDEITAQRRTDVVEAKQRVSATQLRDQIRVTEERLGPALDVLARLNAPAVRSFSRWGRRSSSAFHG